MTTVKRILEISHSGLKAHDRTLALGDVTILAGPNGTGKTTAHDAIRLTVFGRTTGIDATNQGVMTLARDLGYTVQEANIPREALYIADECFFTGTAAEVTPIRELDRITLGSGSRGPITEKIQTAFFDIVNGRNPKYAHWLTRV